MGAIITVSGLKKYYGIKPNVVHALDGVDMEVEAGEFVAVIGMSGSGKSTLLHMIGGLDRPTDGKVVVAGQEVTAMQDEELSVFRRRSVGFVFQSYNLVPVLSVYENIVLPIELDGRAVDKSFVDKILTLLKLDDRRTAMPNQLSGGQQQRVAIARALATKPSVLLADEPTGNLDSKTGQAVLELLRWTSRKFNQTIIMITHDERIAKSADRVVSMEDGRLKDSAENEG